MNDLSKRPAEQPPSDEKLRSLRRGLLLCLVTVTVFWSVVIGWAPGWWL